MAQRGWLSALWLTAACGGSAAGPGTFDAGDGDPATAEPDAGAECESVEALFARSVQPSLAVCRTCHAPEGVAALHEPAPARFLLSGDPADDLARLRQSWEELGGNDPVSRILLKAAGGESHPGGALWPEGSPAYERLAFLFERFAQPALCGGGDAAGEEWPLLGSSHGGSPLYDFCEGQSDATLLPPDPRSLVRPGVNAGKAVHFNAFWKDCHRDPALVGELPQPRTCGELRERVAIGRELMRVGGPEAGALFTGGDDPFSDPAAVWGLATFTADQYNQLWKSWGLDARPDNFDQLVAERYGAGFGAEPNPYPRPGEDPNRTKGGTGKLPVFFSQLHRADGSWSGHIGVTCHGCHSGEVGTPRDGERLGVIYGGGSSLHDYNLFLRDMLPLGYIPSAAMIANLNRTRGTSNASAINLAFFFQEEYDLASIGGLLRSGSTAGMDTPAWWNLGHRPVKFVDGIFATDASRVDLVFYTPFYGLLGALGAGLTDSAQAWMRAHGQAVNDWASTLKSPPYPRAIDIPLAEQGAVLFHQLDLWAEARANPLPRPAGGNGSCASCHGAYSPRFVHDARFLDDPALEGVAAFIVPLDIIATDAVRLNANNEGVQSGGSRNFFGYPETAGTSEDCGMQNRVTTREPGYLAPPLYGVWATAPYLHNGSVPNLWQLLAPEERPAIWRRLSKPARADQVGKVVMGYDTSLERAFDFEHVGFRHDRLACGEDGTNPYLDCDPDDAAAEPPIQGALDLLFGNVVAAWNLLYPPITSNDQVEERKIYNTHLFAQEHGGHAFTAVLTDAERRALLEYLKTL
jgi:hypothetical protein